MNHLLHTQPTELWVPQAWGGRGNLDMASTLNINWQLSGTTATIFSLAIILSINEVSP